MFDQTRPPVMRGDLFTLLDTPPGQGLTAETVSSAARRLVASVTLGERAPGTPVVMDCLSALAQMAGAADDDAPEEPPPVQADVFMTLRHIRSRLVALGGERSQGVPWSKLRERAVVLPQRRSARLVRAVPVASGFFVLTREASEASPPDEDEVMAWAEPEPVMVDGALGGALPPRVDVTFRLFRFGAKASDIRMVMRIIQEPGTFRPVLAAGDDERVAVMSRDIVGIFTDDGKPVLSGRVPLDLSPEVGAEVTAIALEGDVLAITMRTARDRPVELALMNLAQKKGLPVGVVGQDASAMVLGRKEAFIVDGVNLLRVPLFQPGADIDVFRLRPWFAEYPFTPDKMMAWEGGRLWISNGQKLVVMADDLSAVLAEIVLPTPILDFHVGRGELGLVTFDPDLAVARITTYEMG